MPIGTRVVIFHLEESPLDAELVRDRLAESGVDAEVVRVDDRAGFAAALAEADRDRALAEARAARDEARTANRMKDQFLATLSHELRTPLNAVLGWANLLATGKLPPETVNEGLAVIARNARAQAQLIDDLLDVSRIISGKLTLDFGPVDLADVVGAAVAAVGPAAEAKGVTIETRVGAGRGPVRGDPARLEQVAWNLLSNAVKFTPGGGRVEVRVEYPEAGPVLTVADTGDGIAADFLPHVFDRFRQADPTITRRQGGLGLGLSIVRQLVELHGGAVRAASDGPGRGATFAVTLPRSAAAALPIPPGPPAEVPPGRSLAGVRVLVVDDERDSREMARLALTEAGAEVALAGTVAEALDQLRSRAPDILVSDIGMPGRGGYDLIREVRADGPSLRDLPAVALTAFARPEDRQLALAAGFGEHLCKPVDPEVLVAVVAGLAGRCHDPGERGA